MHSSIATSHRLALPPPPPPTAPVDDEGDRDLLLAPAALALFAPPAVLASSSVAPQSETRRHDRSPSDYRLHPQAAGNGNRPRPNPNPPHHWYTTCQCGPHTPP
ncbi:hypothetical protein BCR44DRAFT_1440592 [Catenaria anguillulae PL171]|uniref:Uncharacterized protein n=1 Tax=Catenaria anguillulae PL171 TaxID=765915 RepID=A0A1Y2HEL5_9FUNG|nr:hypothetical protein BCR44DRAFT_1440592 [Catenaria anguillulae PL171]